MMFVITYILAATILVGVVVAITNAPCALDKRSDIIYVRCNRQRLTDDAFKETFASLTTLEGKNATAKKNLGLEFHELDETLQVIPNVPQLARVQRLSYHQNQIVSAQTGVFQNLPSLRYLDLSYNRFTGSTLVKEVFQSQNKNDALPVEVLNLENNNISSLNFDVFSYLRKLTSLNLSKNPIKIMNAEFADAFRILKDLKVLQMTQAELSTLPDYFLKTNVIHVLHVNGNRFTQVPKCLRNIRSSLYILNLSGNLIQKLDATSFDMLSNLNELRLSSMETLTEIAANTFSPLISLRRLECAYNSHLKTIDSAAFEGLKSRKWRVQELILKNNGLEFLKDDTLPWDKLDLLDLSGNPWKCMCSLKWLLNLTRNRQHSDPESNLGMHCEYPPRLKNKSLIEADTILKCSSGNDSTQDSSSFASSLRYMWSTTALLICTGIFALSIVLYFIIRQRKRARMLKVRYSGVVGRSIVKYKRTQLNEDDSTQTTDREP